MAHDSTEDRTLKRRHPRIAHFLAAVLVLAATTAPAQDYPNRPIRFIVPYPPGGGTDVVARIMNEALAAELGQPIIIDNRGGAAGNVGTDLAAKAPADGYNILFTLSSHTINPKLYDKLPFDVERDFVPISLAAMIPQILVVHPSVPANNVQGADRAGQGQSGQAQLRVGRHRFARPHRRRAVQDQDRRRHRAHSVQGRRSGGHRHDRRSGAAPVRLDARGVAARQGREAQGASPSRAPSAASPRPTCRRSPSPACPDYVVDSWYGAFAPAKTPPAAVARLNAAFAKVLENPQVKEKLLAQGAEAASSTPGGIRPRDQGRAREMGPRDQDREDPPRMTARRVRASRRTCAATVSAGRAVAHRRRVGARLARGAARVRDLERRSASTRPSPPRRGPSSSPSAIARSPSSPCATPAWATSPTRSRRTGARRSASCAICAARNRSASSARTASAA